MFGILPTTSTRRLYTTHEAFSVTNLSQGCHVALIKNFLRAPTTLPHQVIPREPIYTTPSDPLWLQGGRI